MRFAWIPLFFSRRVTLALWLVVAASSADAQGLTHLQGPRGGQIVYGNVVGANTLPAAMGIVLSSVHAQFGVKPEVGRVIELKGSESAAVYFSVQPNGRPPAAGMVVISKAANGFEAGIVTDETARLQTSFNPMLQTLFAAWHPAGKDMGQSSQAGASSGPSRPVPPLRTFTLPDRTASVDLPEGWKVTPSSGGGSIYATGPRNEQLGLGNTTVVFDSSTPQGRQLQQQGMGPLRNTVYGSGIYYPYGRPLAQTMVDVTRMQREKNRLAPIDIRVTSEDPMPAQGGSRCTRLRGDVGPRDGLGPTRFDTIYCVAPQDRASNSFMTVSYSTAVPVEIADESRATMTAIVASFRTDQAAVQRMANQIAAPGIAAIHEIGRQATLRAAEADRTRISMRQSYEARSNAQDRSSQAFSNYIRDQTVVVDRDNNAHGTVWNSTAESMVKNDPRRFGYVDTPNFWKGVDY